MLSSANITPAVASHLALYSFTLKTKGEGSPFDPRKPVQSFSKITVSPVETSEEWSRGAVYAGSQNLARTVRSRSTFLLDHFLNVTADGTACQLDDSHCTLKLHSSSMSLTHDPQIFCERVKSEFAGLENVEITVHDEGRARFSIQSCLISDYLTPTAWAEEKGMNVFLSVTHGTAEPAKFLEM